MPREVTIFFDAFDKSLVHFGIGLLEILIADVLELLKARLLRLKTLPRMTSKMLDGRLGEISCPHQEEEPAHIEIKVLLNPFFRIGPGDQPHKQHGGQPDDFFIQHDPFTMRAV